MRAQKTRVNAHKIQADSSAFKNVSFIKRFFSFCIIIEKVARRVISCKDGVRERESLVQKEKVLTRFEGGGEGERGQEQTNAAEWGRGGAGELQCDTTM